ncbi:hypothetical protein CBS101457_000113 [Exobasidium rhododendri]|nr:hypothetical protein CBS101457_000113 [Exobasidium rhododendri]
MQHSFTPRIRTPSPRTRTPRLADGSPAVEEETAQWLTRLVSPAHDPIRSPSPFLSSPEHHFQYTPSGVSSSLGADGIVRGDYFGQTVYRPDPYQAHDAWLQHHQSQGASVLRGKGAAYPTGTHLEYAPPPDANWSGLSLHDLNAFSITPRTREEVTYDNPPANVYEGQSQLPYTLKVDPYFSYSTEDDLVYSTALSKDQKIFIRECLLQVRPYTEKTIQTKLSSSLTPRLAKEFLSGEVHRVDAAVEELYPIDQRKRGAQGKTTWMKDLDKWQRIRVIEIMADATGLATDDLRELFLKRKISPDTAQRILHATGREECRAIAQRYALTLPENEHARAWQKGVSQIERRALRQRMLATRLRDELGFYDLLRKRKIPRGYGLDLLRANDRAFMAMMLAIVGHGPLLPRVCAQE